MSKADVSSFWTLSASLSVLSSRYLLIELDYHFPLHLLLINLFIVLAFLASPKFVVALKLRYNVSTWLRASLEYNKEPSSYRKWYHDLPKALCVAVSLPLSMQAILHWTNLCTLVMMPAFAYLCDEVSRMFSGRHSIWINFLQALVPGCCCAAILYDEYRLTVVNILCVVLGMLSAGLSLALCRMRIAACGTPFSNNQSCPSPITTVITSFAITLAWCIKAEDTLAAAMHIFDVDPLLLGLHVGSTVAAILLGGSFIVPLNIGDRFRSDSCEEAALTARISTSFGMTAVVGLASTYLTVRSYSTVLQICAYCATLTWLFNGSRICTDGTRDKYGHLPFDLERLHPPIRRLPLEFSTDEDEDSNSEQRLLAEDEVTDRFEPHASSPSALSMAAYAVILLAWLGFLVCNFTSPPDPDITSPLVQLDSSYSPSHNFDVVISMYKEPVTSIQSIMEELSKITAINASSPRLFLYTKDEAVMPSNITALGEMTSAHKVIKLPNVGREGETYLEHILLNWDSLARQTLFVQADVHNPREFFSRIQNFYTAETGMLSLGFSGKVCETGNCGDRWGWEEEPTLLNKICERVNGETCSKILLSYKGQFIASAKRIRGIDRAIYEDLRTAMTDPDSWAHKEPYLKGRTDSLNAPRFGYSLERLWSVMMQCSAEEIAWKCPTLLSRTRRGGDPSDCQCFDPVDSPAIGSNSTSWT